MEAQLNPSLIGPTVKFEDGKRGRQWWRMVPVDAGEEFLRVSFTTNEKPAELKAGDRVVVTYNDSIWGHFKNYFAARGEYAYRTPIVDGVVLKVTPN